MKRSTELLCAVIVLGGFAVAGDLTARATAPYNVTLADATKQIDKQFTPPPANNPKSRTLPSCYAVRYLIDTYGVDAVAGEALKRGYTPQEIKYLRDTCKV